MTARHEPRPKAERIVPVRFATLYHAAMSAGQVPYPPAVLAWAEESEANAYLLRRLDRQGRDSPDGPVMLKLIDEILADVGGK